MKRLPTITWFFLCLFFLGGANKKAPDNLLPVIAKLQKTYDSTTDFTLHFKQRYSNPVLKHTDESQGVVLFKKPGLLRWDYEKPSKKSFIIDGKALWVHQVEDQVAYVDRCFKESGLTASISFLWGTGKILEQFTAKWSKQKFGEKADHHIELTPRKKNSFFKTLTLVIDPKSFRVKQSIVMDLQNNQNQFAYDKMRFNSGLTAESFAFKPDKDTHVSPIPGSCHDK